MYEPTGQMRLGTVEFGARQKPLWDGYGVDVYMRLPHERRVVTQVTFTVEDAEPNRELTPAMSLEPHEAQSLMDALWESGVRPSNGEGSTGKLAATERHLEDMRTLVFKGMVTA